MTTKDDDKGDEQKAQRSIKEQLKWIKKNSRVQDKNQEEFKTQEEILESRIKIQGSKSQESRSRIKIQESREGLIKISMKSFSQKLSSTLFFLKHVYQRVFTLW